MRSQAGAWERVEPGAVQLTYDLSNYSATFAQHFADKVLNIFQMEDGIQGNQFQFVLFVS